MKGRKQRNVFWLGFVHSMRDTEFYHFLGGAWHSFCAMSDAVIFYRSHLDSESQMFS